MNPLEKQIKELQRKQKKVEIYQEIADNLLKQTDSQTLEVLKIEQDYPGLIKEVCTEVISFLEHKRSILCELGHDVTVGNSPMTTDVAKEGAATQVTVKPPETVKQLVDPVEPTDPIRFLLKYKFLDGKLVNVTTPNGDVKAKVVGLLTPYIRVETETGYTVNVEPKHIKVIK